MDRPGGENPVGSGILVEVTPALPAWQLPELGNPWSAFGFEGDTEGSRFGCRLSFTGLCAEPFWVISHSAGHP
jgi:hypothetical protein